MWLFASVVVSKFSNGQQDKMYLNQAGVIQLSVPLVQDKYDSWGWTNRMYAEEEMEIGIIWLTMHCKKYR